MQVTKRLLADVSLCAFLLYAGFWVYEGLNYALLSILGSQASLILSGALPVGVSASVPDSGAFVLAKPAQVALSALAMFAVFRAVRGRGLPGASTVSLTMVSVYIASVYWELLSAVGPLSYEAHMAIFTALAIGSQLGLSTLFKS